MYHEIQRLIREGLSLAAISKRVVMNPRSVKRYSRMSEAEYASFLQSKELQSIIPHFAPVAPKTVYNFVMAMRQKYNNPLEQLDREYFVVEELPYGQQAQADFGHYILRGTKESRKRIHFFVMMLSRARMKFVRFSDFPFTPRRAIDAHEEAFRFFSGIPSEVVYDQDRLFLIEERRGELLLTQEFKD